MPSKRRIYISKGDIPPTKICPQCKLAYALLAHNDHKSKNLAFYYPDQKYCSHACANRARNKGFLDKHGYRIISQGSRGRTQRPEHHIVMERMIGREMRPGETVHHKNGIRHDNRPENLELWASRHGKGQRVADLGPHWLPIYGAAMSLF